MKRKLPSTFQGDIRKAKRSRVSWLSMASAADEGTSCSSGSPHGLQPLDGSTTPLLPVRHQSLISDGDDRGVSDSTEAPPPAADLLVQACCEGQVPSIQATPTSVQLSPCSMRNPVISVSQSGVPRNPSARRVGNARAYRLPFLSTAPTGSQEHVERQVARIQAPPTSTQLSPCSMRNHVISGSQPGVHQNPSARRFGNARTYRLSWHSTTPAPGASTSGSSGSSPGDDMDVSVSLEVPPTVPDLSVQSTGSQAHFERQVSSIQPASEPLVGSVTMNPTSHVTASEEGGISHTVELPAGAQTMAPHLVLSGELENDNSLSSNGSFFEELYQELQVLHQNPETLEAGERIFLTIMDELLSEGRLFAQGEPITEVTTAVRTPDLSKLVKKVACCGEQDQAEHCVICLEHYGNGDEMGQLKCSHKYHFSCICKWMERQTACPLCRCRASPF